MFKYQRRIQFYETDLMGIVHHSNYLRFFEEARVSWLNETGLIRDHSPDGENVAAVLETRVRHHKPCRFNDDIEVHLEVKLERLKILFQYAVYLKGTSEPLATGGTTHILVDREMKVRRLPEPWAEVLQGQTWTQNWL